MSRDIRAAYRDAMVAEYESYRVAGRNEDAGHVAAALKARYDYDVEGSGDPVDPEPKKEKEPAAPEHTAAEKAPETTAEPSPARAAKKTAAARPARPGA